MRSGLGCQDALGTTRGSFVPTNGKIACCAGATRRPFTKNTIGIRLDLAPRLIPDGKKPGSHADVVPRMLDRDAEAAPAPAGRYDHLSQQELVALLEKRDRKEARIGLRWSADAAERDQRLNGDFAALRLDAELSNGPGPWSNLVIEGDNFDALRWLRMTMAGRVRCIFVDPPYNTGAKDWAYNDAYRDPGDPFHDTTWLEFLHQRFRLAHDLLAEDGVLFCCINDEKRAVVELMLEQTMPGMRVGSLVWRTRDTTSAKDRRFSPVHEHVLIWGGPKFEFNGTAKSQKKYKNPDGDLRGPWNVDPLTLAFDRFDRENLFYPLHDPDRDIWYPCEEDRVWAYASREFSPQGTTVSTEFIEDWIAKDFIVFPGNADRVEMWETMEDLLAAIDNGDIPKTPKKKIPLLRRSTPDLEFWVGKRIGFGRPGFKKHWGKLRSHISPMGSWITRKNEPQFEEVHSFSTEGSGAGTNDLQAVFGRKAFPNPKPVTLVRELVRQSTGPGDVVLDFFAGSGTTAQAVMELNAEDDAGRRFVVVSHDEATEDHPDRNLARDVLAKRIRLLNDGEGPREVEPAPFAYMRTRLIPAARLMNPEADGDGADLAPEDVWIAVQVLHDRALAAFDPEAAVQISDNGDGLIAFVDRMSQAAVDTLETYVRRGVSIHCYTWTPGPVRRALDGADLDLHRLPGALWDRFAS